MDSALLLRGAARRVALAVAVLLVAVPSALGAGSGDRIVRTSAGTSAAKVSVLAAYDLGSGTWTGGSVPAPQTPFCETAGAGRVVNGAAATEFHGPGMKLQSSVAVFQTAATVERDFAGTYASGPALLRCFRAVVAQQLVPSERLVSVGVRTLPKVARFTQALRAVIAVKTRSGAGSKVAFDAILIGAGRSEATLLVTSPMSSFVDVWEQQLAQTFAGKLAL
jgi:hypothetical protein